MAIIDKPSDYFNTKLYTGNASTQTISDVNFQPNLTWIKNRNGVRNHMLFDSVRGALYRLQSNTTAASASTANTLTSWNSDGFALGSENDTNGTGATFASWNWKAGTSFTNDASGTGIGSIDSTGSVNQDAGFSIVSYTGNSPTATTVKHGLNSIPQMIIFKRLVGAGNWATYHQATGNTKALFLNTTAAPDTSAGYFNNTTPTSSVFSVANSGDTNSNGNAMIAYCFAEKQGYSKFGSYTGNGNADGTFVYTGFKPAYVMVKKTSGTENWYIFDNKRSDFNLSDDALKANTNSAELADWGVGFDFLSNGFKARATDGAINASGGSYIYMAFAQNPFVTSTGNGSIPATAR